MNAFSLFPDLDGLDGLISESESVLGVYAAVLALLVAFVVAGSLIERRKRRSPVEKILRRRIG
jgi:hypothetical protein